MLFAVHDLSKHAFHMLALVHHRINAMDVWKVTFEVAKPKNTKKTQKRKNTKK